MPIKVDFELLKQTIQYITDCDWNLLDSDQSINMANFFYKLRESSTFAHLAHKQLSVKGRPFDKLKELWNEWEGFAHSNFEMFIWCHYMEGEWATFLTDTDKQVHQWLAQHCGFLTTAEIRKAIFQLKEGWTESEAMEYQRNIEKDFRK